jgi:16S rRNA C1402 (ribose-2'-O) methylase RsmI
VTLAECDQRALERFQMLDHMEAEDEKNAARLLSLLNQQAHRY